MSADSRSRRGEGNPKGLPSPADLIVVGSGPAGLAITAAAAAQGLEVVALSPTPPTAPWVNTYGIWEDELIPLGLTHLLGRRYTDVAVYVQDQQIKLPRVYGLFDNAALQAHLLDAAANVRWVQAGATGYTATGYRVAGASIAVQTQRGDTLLGRAVVDATGHSPRLIRRVRPTRPLAFQAAYGILGTFTRPPVAAGAMSLMDYRDDHLTPAERRDEPPTFLYAMDMGKGDLGKGDLGKGDMGEGQYFVEETSLAHAPAMPLEQLEDRLRRRLAYAGVAVAEVTHVERCLFPMNHAMPDLRQPVIGFGGAASMVHPATGYQVGAALTLAPRLAAALATALAQPTATPSTVAAAGWDAVWPTDRRRRHALYHFGLDALMDFDAATLQAFFATFFAQPLPRWADYLSNRHTTGGVLRTMWGIFLAAPGAVQWGLVSHGVRTLARRGRMPTSSPAPSP